jgi:hypothetical protein
MPEQNTEAQLIINALTVQRDTNANAAASAMARVSYLEHALDVMTKTSDNQAATIADLRARLASAAAATPPAA